MSKLRAASFSRKVALNSAHSASPREPIHHDVCAAKPVPRL
ncbi:MAG TPA: hypothetical protein VLM37_02480 [Fibrobacteraceae bacterium]|nr:hypothetical protein [Fibrobacteraceae bacterium]